jgi:membrane protease subunit (stomatin/prohibitin family)
LIVAAIGLSIAVVVKTARVGRARNAPQQTVSPQLSSPKTEETELSRNKFCIYCGCCNKSFAVYCESCGKKIA